MNSKIKFILNTSVNYFGINENISDDLPIREFLENYDVIVLSATKKENKLDFSHAISEDENSLVFYKIPQIGKNNGDDAQLGLITLEGGLAKSIYNSVSTVFSPYVAKKIQYPVDLEILIENLHSTLGNTLGLPQSSINSIQYEINYWNEKAINSTSKSDKETAKVFADAIDKLNQLLRNVGSINSLEEFLDNVHTNLDELWRFPQIYPQKRMVELIDIISLNIVEFCADQLNELNNIWNVKSLETDQTIYNTLDAIRSWIQICDSLTRLFWPNYSRHTWIGAPHIPKSASLFEERLKEVQNIKNVYKEIVCLFNEVNQIDKTVQKIFIPFEDINIFDMTQIGCKKWSKALQKYQSILEPINEKIAVILKSKLYKLLDEPREIIQVFLRYDTVFKSSDIIELLSAEREHFLETLHVLLKEMKEFLTETHEYPKDSEISALCWETKGLKMFQNELKQIEGVIHIVKEIDGYDVIKQSLDEIQDQTEKWLNSNFEAWREQSLALISQGELTLKDDKPVVEFEKDGRQLMQVTFKPKLVMFCSDVREFEDMGFRIPIELRNTAMHAIKFKGHARKLQRIATFHNTIGDRMVPCLRPIMLKNAVELSNLVRSESVAWNDEESVQRYVSTLQISVNNLSRDNTVLTEYHEKTKQIMMKLMNTDLLRQGDIWKEEMKNLRNIITNMELKNYTNLQAFKIHWDHQLYKVLEFQYLMGILDLNHRLPDISIDVVFRQQEIQFRPTMEEIRMIYYSQLRRFIERPLTFKGLSEHSGNIFKNMVDINRHHFTALYEKAEMLFEKLIEFQEVWRPFVILGCINLEDLCQVYLKTRDDWDKNFKACKYFSQQIAKIPSAENYIDCFVINTSPIRSDIEFISRKYWEMLTSSLRSSILKDVTTLQDFLNTSLQVLQIVPSMDEEYIEEAGQKCERIITDLPNMVEVLKSVEAKDSCLAGWCRERVSALTGIQNQWEQLQPLIDNHSAALKVKIDIVKNQIEFQMANLKNETEKFIIRWESALEDLEKNEETDLNVFKERQQNWIQIQEQKEKLEKNCEKYNIPFMPEIQEIFQKMSDDINSNGQQWEHFQEFMGDYNNVTTEEWTVYRRRPYILNDFITKWYGKISNQSNMAAIRIRKVLDGLQSVMPVLQSLQSDGLTEKHWANIFRVLGLPYKPYHDITLKDVLIDVESLNQNATDIQQLVRKAASEQIVRQALTELDQWGAHAEVKTAQHKDSNGHSLVIIKDFQDVLNKVGDNQILLQSAKNSVAFESYSDQAEIWENRLASLDHILNSLNQIQRKWIYLEPIFGMENLIAEGSSFKQINKDFRYIMKEIAADARVLSIVKIHGITNIISSLESQLNRCQGTLTTFINTKRNAFPRFYFLSNDDLLELLGQASKEHIIQKHIKKLFPGIHNLKIDSTNNKNIAITGVSSSEGEQIDLINVIEVTGGPIEQWLNQLLTNVKQTLMDLIVKCCQNEKLTEDIIRKYPEQVLCLSKAINFTKQTEKSINTMNLQSHLKSLKEDIDYYTSNVFQNVDNLTAIKVRALLIDLVHYVTIVQQLIDESVTNTQDWCWIQQIKFYINAATKNVTVRMVYAEFDYSYEYLGNINRLVDTTLTHNCYLTLTQAMQLGLGGNPFGPAGTGKTECVKSLGALLGRLVLVFNCSENVDVTAIGLILAGLARCGAWGCFDEFNRLQEATLSVLSMLIQPIQTAIQNKAKTVTVFEDPIPLNLHCGIFVTLNPAGEEYGGRQALPPNLQALFRPIVMQQPEPKEIARVLLFVEGFKNAEMIGSRMVELFNLARKILSPQRHYDWGLRELKTVLLACGRFLRERSSVNGFQDKDDDDEMKLAVHALRSNTMSKLSSSDCKRFDMLINHVFANTESDMTRHDDLKLLVTQAFMQLNLQVNDIQLEKCLQLYEQLEKRMGVVVLGPPRSGKTTIISVLKQAVLNSGMIVKSYTISPKSMSRVQLLGILDPDTRQWNDGVLTSIAIAVNDEPKEIKSWIICDGDVDPNWIEALNSVLDDNKLLTLPSGWRIQFGANVNFIFETHDLIHASPATISRMGIVNLSASDLHESCIIDTWIGQQISSETAEELIKQYIPKSLNWVHKKQIEVIRTGFLKNILQCLNDVTTKEQLCVRLICGVGYALPEEYQTEFATKVFEWTDVYIPSGQQPKYCYYNEARNTVDIFESDHIIDTDSIDNIATRLIKTAKIKSYLNVLKVFLEQNVPFLMIGPSGAGTSLLLQGVVSEMSGCDLITINCSSQLTTSYVLYMLKQNALVVSGNRGREYKPKFNKILLFFKNIDLCYTDEWGTCEVIELILQLIYRNGFYSDTLEWISVSGLQICCSMSNAPKQHLSPRYLAIAQPFVTEFPDDTDLHLIMKNQMMPIFNYFKHEARQSIDQVVSLLVETYFEIKKTFSKDLRNHYIFTPKMLSKLIECLKYYPVDYFQQAIHNEAIGIFRNRLVSDEHKMEFDQILNSKSNRLFDIEKTKHFFVPNGAQSFNLNYMPENEWSDIVKRNITICNTESICMEIVVTQEILSTTASVCRALSRPSGHLILSGLAGSGKLESMFIAGTFLNIKMATITPVKNYGLDDFYNDIKMAMQTAALDDQHVSFYIENVWISYLPDILNPIEALLEGSEIPNLFGDDLESVAKPLRNAALQDGYQDSLTAYFWKKVKEKLHIVILLESDGNNIPELFTKYSVLYKNTEIIWMTNNDDIKSESMVQELIKLALKLNTTETVPVPKYLAVLEHDDNKEIWNNSPYRFKHLIFSYCHFHRKLFADIQKQQQVLQAGVDKLSAAHKVVQTLKEEAEEQEIALNEKRELANNALEMITTTMKNATNQKSDLMELKTKAQENSKLLLERKAAVELELKDVEPILKEAVAAVGQIKTEALSEIRSLRAPPEIIRDILEGVLRLMGTRDTSWNSMKSFLAKRGVKEDIRSLEPARITVENCNAVEKLIASKPESFDVKNAKRASAAAAPLASWVIANVKYCRVIQSIKPLEEEQEMLQRNLKESENNMKLLKSGLEDVEAKVKELSGQLNVYTQEAAVLELKLDTARNTLKSSEVLVTKLSTEYANWRTQLHDMNKDISQIDLYAFFLSLSISHLSHLTYDRRHLVLNDIKNEFSLHEMDLSKKLLSDQDRIIWESMGLTSDVQSMENAAILTKILTLTFGSTPVPLLHDPTNSAITWLPTYLKSHDIPFEITSQHSERFTYILELAIRFGKVMIVKDCTEIKPPLLGLISYVVQSRFNKKLLPIGSKLVDLHDNFKLILVTRTVSESISKHNIFDPYITVIPFTTTCAGLTDQLMTKSIQVNQPSLETKRIELLRNESDLLKKRTELQDKLLIELSTSQGDILKNETLLKTLNEVKASSQNIDVSLKESDEVKAQLMQEYAVYKNICFKMANLYIGIDKIYSLSVTVFTSLYIKSMQNHKEFIERKVYEQIVKLTYNMLSRSLPKSEHITLGLNVLRQAYPEQVPAKEWDSFISNFIMVDEVRDHSIPAWIKKSVVPKVLCLKHNHSELYDTLNLAIEHNWNAFMNSNTLTDIPANVTDFQKILVTQIFRPDLLTATMIKVLTKTLGTNVPSEVKPSISVLLEETKESEPIVFITDGEIDPAKDIQDYAISKFGSSKYIEIAIGKGQENVVLQQVRKAADGGNWICVKNVQLVPLWLQTLNEELQTLTSKDGFRVWLICDSIKHFPQSLLAKCNKVIYETPNSIKSKVQRLLQQWTRTLEEKKNDAKLIKLYIVLFFFNAVLQERRSYVPQGWSTSYEFSDADLKTAMDIIGWMEQTNKNKIVWSILKELFRLIAYGGRINNSQDQKILKANLDEFFTEKMFTNTWSPLHFKINIPLSHNLQDHLNVLYQLSDSDRPEVFGLSAMTVLLRDSILCRNVFKQLRRSEISMEGAENFEKRLKPILGLWKKLNEGLSLVHLSDEVADNDNDNITDPWQSFTVAECTTANKLFKIIHRTLVTMHTATKDITSITRDDMTILRTICENQVPLKWRQIWSGPKLIIDYLKAAVSRGVESERRYQHDLHLPFCEQIDLARVYNVDSFLAALKLKNARELDVSTCDLSLITTLAEPISTLKTTKSNILSILVDGAAWRDNKIELNSFDPVTGGTSNTINNFSITFGLQSRPLDKFIVELPLYNNSTRGAQICEIQIRAGASSESIILSGAALIVPDI